MYRYPGVRVHPRLLQTSNTEIMERCHRWWKISERDSRGREWFQFAVQDTVFKMQSTSFAWNVHSRLLQPWRYQSVVHWVAACILYMPFCPKTGGFFQSKKNDVHFLCVYKFYETIVQQCLQILFVSIAPNKAMHNPKVVRRQITPEQNWSCYK